MFVQIQSLPFIPGKVHKLAIFMKYIDEIFTAYVSTGHMTICILVSALQFTYQKATRGTSGSKEKFSCGLDQRIQNPYIPLVQPQIYGEWGIVEVKCIVTLADA